MISMKNFSIVFYLIQLFVSKLMSNKICDTTHNLSVDSTLLMMTGNNSNGVLLFSDNDVFELRPISHDKQPKIVGSKRLEDLSINLSKPITRAVENSKNKTYFLRNSVQKKRWELHLNWTLISFKERSDPSFDAYITGDYLVIMERTNTSTKKILLKYWNTSTEDSITIYSWKKRQNQNVQQIKRIWNESNEFNDPDSQFFGDLNGHEISAAFSLTTNSGEEVLHLFANRSFCRMKISDKEWLPFCKIQDISEWVDCNGYSSGKPPAEESGGFDIV